MAVPEFDVGQDTLGQIAQSLQEVRKMARSIENSAMSFLPLTDHDVVKDELTHIITGAGDISKLATSLYQRIARKALGGNAKV